MRGTFTVLSQGFHLTRDRQVKRYGWTREPVEIAEGAADHHGLARSG
jgi:hypothetical protein